ncbi:MAG: FAD-binding oxidoreductase, partial [Deltaproteobacteria bacterium]
MLVVGGGIIGASIADALLEEGHHVLLLERGAIGREASW